MSQGILVFAENNSQVDYVKQAYFLALRSKEYLNLPVSIVTDAIEYVKTFPDYENVFDKIIQVPYSESSNIKRYHDGALVQKQLSFKNDKRPLAYELSPYNETLLLDTDIVIGDNKYIHCFDQEHNFLIYQRAYDLAGFRDYSEFDKISDAGVDFYWATCVFFRKTDENEIFFNLLKHIQENWQHYKTIFQITYNVYRNDHAFSIAIHIMNGYQKGSFTNPMPGILFYTTDRDVLWKLEGDKYQFLLEKENYLGEYTACKFSGTVHVMNKFSLSAIIDKELA